MTMKSNFKGLITLLLFMTILVIPSQVLAFTDVNTSDWFFDNVMTMKSRGIINGYPDNSFKPTSNVTHGESIKMVTMLKGLDVFMGEEFSIREVNKIKNDNHWAEPFVQTAFNNKILTFKNTGLDYNKKATRVETIEYIVNFINSSLDSNIAPDEIIFGKNNKSYFIDAYGKGMDFLYNNGILKGSPTKDGIAFNGKDHVTRAEFSALIDRAENFVINYKKGTPISNAVKINEAPLSISFDIENLKNNPFTEEDFVKIMFYMRLSNIREFTVKYSSENYGSVVKDGGTDPDLIEKIRNANRAILYSYPEISFLDNRLTITRKTQEDGGITVTIKITSPHITDEEISARRLTFDKKSLEAANLMVESGAINSSMNEKEIALYLHKWVVDNFKYDYSLNATSYDGYSGLIDGLTVCTGYTAMINRLYSLFNIESIGVAGYAGGDLHAWNEATLDGVKYYIDATWNDEYGNLSYFTDDIRIFENSRTWDFKYEEYKNIGR